MSDLFTIVTNVGIEESVARLRGLRFAALCEFLSSEPVFDGRQTAIRVETDYPATFADELNWLANLKQIVWWNRTKIEPPLRVCPNCGGDQYECRNYGC